MLVLRTPRDFLPRRFLLKDKIIHINWERKNMRGILLNEGEETRKKITEEERLALLWKRIKKLVSDC